MRIRSIFTATALAAAERLVKQQFLLPEDAARLISKPARAMFSDNTDARGGLS